MKVATVEILPHEPDPAVSYFIVVNGQHIRTGVPYASARFAATAIRDALEVVGVKTMLSDPHGSRS